MPLRLAAAACALALCSVASVTTQTPTLEALLERAGQYVAQFVDRFSNVVAEERYVQDTLSNLPVVTRGLGGGSSQRQPARHRELKSDFLLVKVSTLD